MTERACTRLSQKPLCAVDSDVLGLNAHFFGTNRD
jgi:hypothetical protein